MLVFVAAMISGSINSVAGGGALVTFPTLIWLGVPSITANATNTFAVWPGTIASAWGYRRELRGADPRVYALIVPSVIGAVTGAVLLDRTPAVVFDRLVLATCINFVAAAYFAFAGLVIWSDALVMAAGAVAGGVGGATIARRIGRAAVRRIVVVIGFTMALSLMLRL